MRLCIRNEDNYVSEPCLGCPNHYVEDIWGDDCCDAKECIYQEEYDKEYQKRRFNSTKKPFGN